MKARGAVNATWSRRHGDAKTADRVRWIVRVTGTVLLSAILAALLVWFLLPFTRPLAWAAVLAIVCVPLQHALLWVTRGRQGLAALLVTCLVILCGLVPAVFLGSALTGEVGKAYEGLQARVVSGDLRRHVNRIAVIPRVILPGPLAETVAGKIEATVGNLGSAVLRFVSERLGSSLKIALENVSGLMLNFVVFVLSLYIFLRDGKQWFAGCKDAIPLPPGFRDLLAVRLRDTTRAVVRVLFVVAATQAILLGIGFKLFGVPLPVLFGAIGFFAALIPFIGAATMWILAGLWLWLGQGDLKHALGLWVYGACFVSTIDNVIEPILLGGTARLPAYAMFLAIMGGLIAIGPLGLFLGPVVFAVAFAAAGAYRELVAVTLRASSGARRRH